MWTCTVPVHLFCLWQGWFLSRAQQQQSTHAGGVLSENTLYSKRERHGVKGKTPREKREEAVVHFDSFGKLIFNQTWILTKQYLQPCWFGWFGGGKDLVISLFSSPTMFAVSHCCTVPSFLSGFVYITPLCRTLSPPVWSLSNMFTFPTFLCL